MVKQECLADTHQSAVDRDARDSDTSVGTVVDTDLLDEIGIAAVRASLVCTVSNSVQEVDVGAEALEIRGVTAELAARLCKHVGDTSDLKKGGY